MLWIIGIVAGVYIFGSLLEVIDNINEAAKKIRNK